MKKQTEIEKAAINFALQIFKLIESFPKEERSPYGSELAREVVKLSSGISTFFHLNEMIAGFEFLNNAFSATFRVEIYLLASKDLNLVKSIDQPMKSLEKLRKRLDSLLNSVPDICQM
jgi:hypothetical protein